MLINIQDIVKKYGKPSGVIHVGSHIMQERNAYRNAGLSNIIWIDANDEIVSHIQKTFTNFADDEKIFSCLISDIDNQDVDFYITNNEQSSSMLKMQTHIKHYPHIVVTNVKKYKTKRLDTLFTENNISFSDRNFINLDIQGAELLALKGCGEIMNSLKYIYAEINEEHLYANGCLIHEMDDYLKTFGFSRVEKVMTPEKWGDALYIR